MENKDLILAIAFDHERDKYIVDIPAGKNIAEVAFSMMVVIRCLINDGIIKKPEDLLDLVYKYLNDPQYEEIKEEESDG